MEVLGRLPEAIFRPVKNLAAEGARLEHWRAGRIVTASGRLVGVERRWMAYKATRLRVWWDRRQPPGGAIQCELYFHQPIGNPGFLVLGYVRSHPLASLSSFYCATLALDEIARIKGCYAIVAEVTNERLSDRLLARWGWAQHCRTWRGRHFIKRFYGDYPSIPPAWRERLGSSPATQ